MRLRWQTVILGVVVVAACSDTTSTGPFDQRGTDTGALCTPVAADGSVTFGLETLDNSGPQPAVIRAVDLVEPVGLSIIESRIVTIPGGRDGGTLVGSVLGYPPQALPGWDNSVLAVGATIPPAGSTRDAYNLVVGLQMDPDADRASAPGIEVD